MKGTLSGESRWSQADHAEFVVDGVNCRQSLK
jgi:hypothetical protein